MTETPPSDGGSTAKRRRAAPAAGDTNTVARRWQRDADRITTISRAVAGMAAWIRS